VITISGIGDHDPGPGDHDQRNTQWAVLAKTWVGPGDNGPRLEDEVRFIGIDVGSQNHLVAIVNEVVQVLLEPTSFAEDAGGYDKLRKLLGEPTGCLVAMETTGHYGKNLLLTFETSGAWYPPRRPDHTSRGAHSDPLPRCALGVVARLVRPAPVQLGGEGVAAAARRVAATSGRSLWYSRSP